MQPFFHLNSFSYSEPVTIKGALNNWETGSFQSGKKQWSSNWLEIGGVKNDWHLGLLMRMEMDLQFSRDTARFYFNTRNDLPIDNNKTYDLRLESQRYQLTGVRAGRKHTINNKLAVDWGISVFSADDLIDGNVSGNQDQLTLDYTYSEDVVLDRHAPRPDGWGASLDFSAKWQVTPMLSFQFRAEDLPGIIKWEKAPYTLAEANSNRSTYDENGYLTVKPVAQGIEGFRDSYYQDLQTKFRIDGRRQIKDSAFSGSLYHRDNTTLLAIGGEHSTSSGDKIGIRFWSEVDTLELTYQRQQFQAGIGIDSFKWDKTHSLWLTLSYIPKGR